METFVLGVVRQDAAAGSLLRLAVTPELLAMLLAGVLAVAFDWFPGLAPWFAGLSRLKKQQLVLALLGLIAGGVLAGSCQGWLETGLVCGVEALPRLLEIILAAASVNQAVHLLARPARA
jgi:hypothetical protein